MKTIRAILGGLRLIRDPNRLDEVFQLADGLATPQRLQPVIDEVKRDPAAARAFREKKRLGRPSLDDLARLPEGTLGRVFADHMRANGLSLEAIPLLPSTTDAEFFRAHMYETHDVWHVVTGFGTDVPGELGLQAFYLAQLPGRLSALLLGGALLNTAIWAWDDREPRTREIVRGWLLGKRTRPLFGTDWASLWETPLADVRARLGFDRPAVDAIVETQPIAA